MGNYPRQGDCHGSQEAEFPVRKRFFRSVECTEKCQVREDFSVHCVATGPGCLSRGSVGGVVTLGALGWGGVQGATGAPCVACARGCMQSWGGEARLKDFCIRNGGGLRPFARLGEETSEEGEGR